MPSSSSLVRTRGFQSRNMGSNPIDGATNMIILAIETSCDETAVAVLEIKQTKTDFFIHPCASIIASQVKIHKFYGGVVPMLASREHQKNISFVFQEALKKAFPSQAEAINKIDLIAVTVGPGLIPALLIGVNFAKALAWGINKPIIGVNHMEGHLLSYLLPSGDQSIHYKTKELKKIFPAITLLISGGHTQLIYVKEIGDYKIIGETRDDAAGECFDKGARILGLSYPGGPAIAAEAEKYKTSRTEYNIQKLPRPMLNKGDYDFSFSGLKTALLYQVQEMGEKKAQQYRSALSFELQEAITDVLVKKALKAVKQFNARSLILGGGVSANQCLRQKFQKEIRKDKLEINFLMPSLEYTGDNAIMISLAAFFNYQRKKDKKFWDWKQIEAKANLQLSNN